MARLLQLTDNSWLIKDSLENYLLFSLKDNLTNSENKFKLINEQTQQMFKSFADVEKKFGKFTKESVKETNTNKKINGYNVKHTENITVINDNDLPLYTKVDGKIVFVAGYWVVKQTSTNWSLINCPKKSTIDKTDAEGPFLNRLEAMNRVTILNSLKQ